MTQVPTLEKIDVLLVDDRPANLLALESALASPAYNFIKAESGDEALKYLLTHEPALILMDVQMPAMDGFETASIIKKSERTRGIPIIFITALNKDERYTHKGYSHGAVDYIYKPLDIHVLRSKVAVFAELYRKNQQLLQAERQLRDEERHEREKQIAQLELRNLKREQVEQKKYRELIEGIHHGIVWTADPQILTLSFVSPSVESITGYLPEFCKNTPDAWLECVHPDDRRKVLDAISIARTDKIDVRFEHRIRKSDGTIVWLQTGVREGYKEDGSAELRGLSIDITKTKLAEENLRKNKERSDFLAEASRLLSESTDYRVALEQIGNIAIPTFGDGYCIFLPKEGPIPIGDPSIISRLPVKILEISSEEAPKIVDLTNQGLQAAVVAPLLARGRSMGNLILVSNQSARSWDEADLSMIVDLSCRIAIAIDNIHLYKEAQTAIQMRDDFLSIASHELKTPLTPLTLQVQTLIKTLSHGSLDSLTPARLERMLQSCDRQLTRLAKLIENLLDISRINTGKLTLEKEEFDLMELIREVLERFQDQLKAIRCETTLEGPDRVSVYWDRFRIEQVIVNLLSNAMKYGAGRPIVIQIAPSIGGRISLAVRDSGIGIAKEDQERIFERFERAVSGKHFGGLGLGLYIVKQIIEAHEGKVTVTSAVSMGSTFIVDLPTYRDLPQTEAIAI